MEICIDSLESARNAIEGGATRLEVCSLLSVGGLTPTVEFFKEIKKFSSIPLFVMLRIRAGDFVYTRQEKEEMLKDLEILKNQAVDGFVFGALTKDGEIDVEVCRDVLSAARPLPVTFHGAFNHVNDPLKSLQILINLGFKRVLTSGQRDTAEEGLELLKKLVQEAEDKIIVMPGSGITKENILKIKRESGAKEFHGSARVIGMDSTCNVVTDKNSVREMVRIVLNNV